MSAHATLVRPSRAAALAAALCLAGAVQAADWHPLKVNATKADGTSGTFDYSPLPKANKDWLVCVSMPHMKDPFFVAVNYGMVEEAKRLKVRMQTLDAGGYTALANQISQIENCVAGGAQAVVMVGIARDGMNNLLAQLKTKGIPVVDAINGVSSKDTGARVLTSPRDEGLRAGQYLAGKHPAGSKEVKVAWLPGPAGAGFVVAFDDGFKEGIKGSAVKVVETKHGDVGKEVQARLVEDILQTHKDLDYIVGTAVMAEATVPLLRSRKLDKQVKLVSVYMTPGVHQGLKNKAVEAGGAAPVVLTGRIMLDTAVRLLEKKVEYTDVYTLGKVYTPADIGTLQVDSVLSPASFKPVFKLGK